MPRFTVISIACCLCSLLAASASAQGKGSLELGYDLGATYFLVDDEPVPAFGPRRDHDSFRLSFPVTPGLRFGYFLNDRDQIETRVSFAAIVDQVDDHWTATASLGGLRHLSDGEIRPYLRAGGRVSVLGGSADSDAQFGIEGGAGLKTTVGDRLATRLDLAAARSFESDVLGHWDFSAALGLSFFTK